MPLNGQSSKHQSKNQLPMLPADAANALEAPSSNGQVSRPTKPEGAIPPPPPPAAKVPPQRIVPKLPPKKRKWYAVELGFRARATLTAIAIGTLPVLALGTTAYIVANQSVAQETATTQQNQAVQLADGLNRFLFERYNDVRVLANLPMLRDPKIQKATTSQEKQQTLEQLQETYGIYDSIAVFDSKGNPTLQTAGAPLGNIRNQDYFQMVLKTNRPSMGTPEISPSSGIASLNFAAPVQDSKTGRTIAIVVARLPVERLETLLNRDGQPINYYVFDQSGAVLLAKDPSRINQNIDYLFNGIAPLRAAAKPEPLISNSLAFGLSLLKLDGAVQNDHLVGLAKTQAIGGMANPHWGVATAADSLAVVDAQRQRVTMMGLGTLLAASLLAAIAIFTANRASRLIQNRVQDLQKKLQSAEQQQARRSERIRLLTEISENMRQSLRQEDILNTTVSELRYALNTDRIIVYFFESDWCGTVVAESVALGWKKILGEKVEDPLREGLIERYRNGRVRAMNDIYTENLTRCHRDILEGFQIRASIVAPIVQNGSLIGLLCAHQCAGPRQWEEEDIELFSKLSSQLGYVLEQSALQQRQARSIERSRLLNELVGNMRKSLKEEDMLTISVSELRYALNTDRVIVYFFESDWCGTIVAESVALGWEKILGKKVEDPFREGLIERYRNGRVRVMNDIYTENLTKCHQEILEGFQIKASIVAPILQNGSLIGLLCAHHCSGPRKWEVEDVDLFTKLAIQLGFALDQASLLRKQIRTAEQSRLLSEIVGNMRRSMTKEGILNTTVSELRYALNTDRLIVYFFENNWHGTIVAESVAAGWRKILGEVVEDPFQEGLIERYRNGRVRAMNDVVKENLTQCHLEILEGFQIRASIVAPVLQNGNLIGLLCAHQCSGPRQWQAEDVELVSQMAIQLGFALDQTSLLEYTERARQEARQEADGKAEEQRTQKEFLQKRAMELLLEVEPVSKGDLTVRARVTPDEVGTIADSYNTIIKSLRQIVEQVQSASKAVAETASGNEVAVSTLSREAKHQMQGVHQALDQIQMMVESIQGVAQRANRAEVSVQIATQALEAGDEAMNRTVSGISAIRETVSETAKKVKRLGEASQKISRVVSLINGFAAQTNLLALNASIEAARAGEEGQGFAVVAEEVRVLAQQSATATAEIEQLAVEIQTQTNEVVSAMEAGTEQVVTGTQLVEESRQQLSQISEVSSQINQLVKEISQAAAVQTQTSTMVSQTMQQVAGIANETSDQSETVASSFAQLLEVANELQVSVAQFKVR
jgi:methyl-accepting chemotaxis protein